MRRFSFRLSNTIWVAIEKGTQQAIWLLLFAVLAPILGPTPYGLFAIPMVFIGFCELVMVDSAAEALIAVPQLEPKHIGTANAFNLMLAIAAGLTAFLIAGPVASLYNSPEMVPLFRVLAFLPLVSSTTSAPIGLLMRDLQFKPLALRSVLGLSLGGGAAVVLALLGAGVWALVAQVMLQRLAETIILWTAAKTRYRLDWSPAHFRELRGFAASVFFSGTMSFTAGQVPRLIMGYALGPHILGLFTLASRFSEVLIQVSVVPRFVVARVELRRLRAAGGDANAAALAMLGNLAFFAFPMAIGAAAVIPTLFSAWLDSRWAAATLPTQIMLLTCPVMAQFYFATAVLRAWGRPQRDANVQFLQSVTTAVVVVCADPFGLNMVCAALVLRLLVLLPFPWWLMAKYCGLSSWSLVRAQAGILAAAGVMGAGVMLLGGYLGSALRPWEALPLLVVAGVLIYAGLIAVLAPSYIRAYLGNRLRRLVGSAA